MGWVLLGGELVKTASSLKDLSVRYRWRYSHQINICIGEAEVMGLVISCSEFLIEINA
jgi:hypothetical protein